MFDIPMLRTLVRNGWTHNTRQLFEQRLGKEQFDVLKSVYSEISGSAPFIPKASTEGKDICLSFSIPLDSANSPFDFAGLPQIFKGRFRSKVQEFLDSVFPKFKNEEINFLNIGKKFEQLEFDKSVTDEALMKAMGINVKKESYKISDLVKVKHVGDSAKLQKAPDFTSEVVKDEKEFFETIGKLFNKSKNEITEAKSLCGKKAVHYAIKEKGETIGYFSMEIKDGTLNVGNYVLFPQYRGTRHSLNAILTLRDRVLESAKQNGIKVIEADVDANNPKLLGLYKRFGFQENGREFCSYTDEFGKTQTSDTYNLIGYLG